MMACLAARTGRQRQRYVDQFRLVAGCIPYKFDKNCKDQDSSTDSENNRVSVLMISTPNRDDLVFPKGGWEDDETVDEAASREAMEEAGIQGILSENPLGVWEFRSKSSQNRCSSQGRGCRGYMFSLEVTEELEHWPGQTSYNRKWVSIEEAYALYRNLLLHYHLVGQEKLRMRFMLLILGQRLKWCRKGALAITHLELNNILKYPLPIHLYMVDLFSEQNCILQCETGRLNLSVIK